VCAIYDKTYENLLFGKEFRGTVEAEVLAHFNVGYMNVNPVCCLYRQETLSGIHGGLKAFI
jgi:hypothetical protein